MDDTITNRNPKKTGGRRKIEIKKIDDPSRRQVTFSKRRQGLYHKANDLSILCGAEVAILTFSPAGKVHCFGHDVLSTVNKYLSSDLSEEPFVKTNLPCVDEANREYEKAMKGLEEEKNQKKIIEEWRNVEKNWWNDNIDDMGLEDLEEYVSAIQELKNNVRTRMNDLVGGGSGGA